MIRLLHGDCRDVMAQLAADSLDACVTDPPYHLTSIAKRWGNADAEREAFASNNRTNCYKSLSTGFMGKQWDGGDVAFQPDTWRGVWRVLKPGAHMLCFGGTRTFHRMACAIEDAGFEIRDTLCWLYGSGFPKSLDVSKAIDKAAGAKGSFGGPKSAAHAGWIERGAMRGDQGHDGYQRPWMQDAEAVGRNARQYIPATPEAQQWEGWGTALKPAFEPIILARKPLSEGTVAGNVLKHGAGAINIDACRVGTEKRINPPAATKGYVRIFESAGRVDASPTEAAGRWPANVLHDGSDEVEAAFGVFGESTSTGGKGAASQRTALGGHIYGDYSHVTLGQNAGGLGDTGTASRFFYCAKADRADRADSRHPTVKPVSLMRWLVRLITPPGGTVIDPFAGSGTTGEAAMLEGFDALLIEQDAQHVADARHRINRWQGGGLPMFASAAD